MDAQRSRGAHAWLPGSRRDAPERPPAGARVPSVGSAAPAQSCIAIAGGHPRTRRRPIAAYRLAMLFRCEPIGQLLSGRTAVDILFRHIDKVLLAKAALRFRAR